MRPHVALAAVLLLGCALAPGAAEVRPSSVWVRSHNRSTVEVYLLCGNRDAHWLGTLTGKGADAFELPAESTRCASGNNFFLVHHDSGRGYWVGPFRTTGRTHVELVIEKYAALSSARVRR